MVAKRKGSVCTLAGRPSKYAHAHYAPTKQPVSSASHNPTFSLGPISFASSTCRYTLFWE